MDTEASYLKTVDCLTGIGGQSLTRLNRMAIYTLQDLLLHLPHRYEDRTRVQAIAGLQHGHSALVVGEIELTEVLNRGRRSLLCRIRDSSGWLTLRFFHFSASQHSQFKVGALIGCFGEARMGYNCLEMVHPEYKIIRSPDDVLQDSLSPVYPLTEGLRQASLRKAIKQALTLCLASIPDYLPSQIVTENQFPSLQQALQDLHQPQANSSTDDMQRSFARKRLAFEEFLAHHLQLLQGKRHYQQGKSPRLPVQDKEKQQLLSALPFQLTAAQVRVIEEIERDCCSQQPMLRLVQGDVGSGKTVVAACAALQALCQGYQVAIMAPTELLSEQHFTNFTNWLRDFTFPVHLLTGKIKGKQREQLLAAIAQDGAQLVVGTHALFQQSVVFNRLGLIIIDEQHRFGVDQRLLLREKSKAAGIQAHQLVMTATPIPRTQAMLQYADMDISIIDELPPGRKPVVTCAISSQRRHEVISRVAHWVEQGKQVYWVCTLIEESELLQCEAAEKTAELLVEQLTGVRVGLLHGRMKANDKDAVMQGFKSHQYDLLVATTVIEVGVDVPNAGLMIIENPERLGLSQLHQLRGRVGRGDVESFCLLLYQAPLSEAGRHRLGILRETNSGFEIAEKDLQLRGPGEVMGTQQTGDMQFKIADLQQDSELIEKIHEAGEMIMQHSPQHAPAIIQRWLGNTKQYMGV